MTGRSPIVGRKMKKSNPLILGVALHLIGLHLIVLSPSLVNLSAAYAQENTPAAPPSPGTQPSNAQPPTPQPVAPSGGTPSTQNGGDESNMMAITTAYNSGLAALKRDDFSAAGDF